MTLRAPVILPLPQASPGSPWITPGGGCLCFQLYSVYLDGFLFCKVRYSQLHRWHEQVSLVGCPRAWAVCLKDNGRTVCVVGRGARAARPLLCEPHSLFKAQRNLLCQHLRT